MEQRLQRVLFAGLMRVRPPGCGHGSRRSKNRDFAMVLMVAAVAGVLCQIVEAVIDLGRSAQWWP